MLGSVKCKKTDLLVPEFSEDENEFFYEKESEIISELSEIGHPDKENLQIDLNLPPAVK